MKSIYEPLFEPLKIGDVEVKNKFYGTDGNNRRC